MTEVIMLVRRKATLSVLTSVLVASASALPIMATAASAAQERPIPQGDGSYDDLISLYEEFKSWRDRQPAEYSRKALEKRRQRMKQFQKELSDMNVASWDREQQNDYLVTRARFDEQDFILNVSRPWARDPYFYVGDLMPLAFTELPVEGAAREELERALARIPGTLTEAKRNLTEAARDHADFALFNLSKSDNVNHLHPVRETPPPGIIGWYDDFLERALSEQPDLAPGIEKARDALVAYRDWIDQNRDGMTAPNGVGRAHLDWYLRHVKMLPYTSDEVELLAEMEKDRLLAFFALERHRNRDLPEIALPQSKEEYEERLARTDKQIRTFLEEEEFITIPSYIPSDWRELGFNVPYMERETLNFWEQVQFRDPAPDHLHAVIPGHRFDGLVERELAHPIRDDSFGDRREGYAVYLEEAALQGGLLDDQPRVKELIYVFGLWRAVRTVGDVRNQTNEYTQQETIDYWREWTPYLDDGVARKYSYLRPTPAHTLHYTMGAIEMRRLLADRKNQLGEEFVLHEFHDELMARGRIPVALLRYEMTGDDEDMAMFWDRTALADIR
jgi:hypothetical protein